MRITGCVGSRIEARRQSNFSTARLRPSCLRIRSRRRNTSRDSPWRSRRPVAGSTRSCSACGPASPRSIRLARDTIIGGGKQPVLPTSARNSCRLSADGKLRHLDGDGSPPARHARWQRPPAERFPRYLLELPPEVLRSSSLRSCSLRALDLAGSIVRAPQRRPRIRGRSRYFKYFLQVICVN